ncbi:hypothetical protein [Nocardioides alcanivorans]|uniref:hypothetical protein n=1 Tax=Nocardioides alcanivorans TaxID=2897352 RepID=UPI0028985FA7|nr:hypothetical protein [Nocardioides alcanivorans]
MTAPVADLGKRVVLAEDRNPWARPAGVERAGEGGLESCDAALHVEAVVGEVGCEQPAGEDLLETDLRTGVDLAAGVEEEVAQRVEPRAQQVLIGLGECRNTCCVVGLRHEYLQ